MLAKLTTTYGTPVHINVHQIAKIEPYGKSGTNIYFAAPKDDGGLKQYVTEDCETVVGRVMDAYNTGRQ